LRVLRRIFGPKREEVVGGWRRLHNEKLLNVSASPNTITLITSRRMKSARHVARMDLKKYAYNILVGKPQRKNTRKDLGVDGRIVLEWILGK
jgi:hypothetical protein